MMVIGSAGGEEEEAIQSNWGENRDLWLGPPHRSAVCSVV